MKYCRTKERHTWSRHDQPEAHHAVECYVTITMFLAALLALWLVGMRSQVVI